MQSDDVSDQINYIKEYLENALVGEINTTEVHKAAVDYLNTLSDVGHINGSHVGNIGLLINWMMSKHGDIKYLYEFDSPTYHIEFYPEFRNPTLHNRKRPRRLLRVKAKRKMGEVMVPITFTPVEPIQHITFTCTVN